jgi:hypothetical protein
MMTSSRPKGGGTTPSMRRTVATRGAAMSSGGDPQDLLPPEKTLAEGIA